MTTEEKLEKLKKLADAMYYAAQYLTTDASRLHKTMEDYHQFVIQEWHKEEPVSEELEEAASMYAKEEYSRKNPATLPDRCIGCYAPIRYAFKAGANWQKEQIIKRLCNHANIDQMVEKFEDKYKPEKVLDTEYYKRGIFDTIKTIKED